MLARMHRPNTFGHGALVATLSFAVLACTGAAPPSAACHRAPDPDAGAVR